MKKTLIVFGIALTSIVFVSLGEKSITSNGAPLGSTGAPIEHTCAKSGCHAGSGINSGIAQLTVDFNNGNLQYQPGQTYNIKVALSQPTIERFGFQVVAINDNDSTNAGTFVVTDSSRTQVLAGANEFEGRNYMTYRYPGTSPFSLGLGKWEFQWTAPSENVGSVTLYTAAVAANDDGTDLGDSVYTKQITLEPIPTGISETNNEIGISVYPNPAHERLMVNYQFAETGNSTIKLMDLRSSTIAKELSRFDHIGKQVAELNIKELSPGNYLLLVSKGSKQFTQKVVIY